MVHALLSNRITRPSAAGRRLGRQGFGGCGSPRRGRHAFRPAVEALEARLTPSVTYAAQQTFNTGTNPIVMAWGDFNGDGRPDLAVANSGGTTVSVLLNTTAAGASTPSFAAQQTFAAGNTPIAVAVGDFNGDGRPDLAVVNNADKTVSVLLSTTVAGATTAAFASQQTFQVGTNPSFVVVGDFNGDGRPDLAVVNTNDLRVSVLLNTAAVGVPTFAAQQTFAVGTTPYSVAVGDFNGDGRPDLATANYSDNAVSVLLNTTAAGATTAAFASQQTFAAGSNPLAVVAGDFNGDGRPDLAVANVNGNTVSVLLNTTSAGAGAAAFATQQTFQVGPFPHALAVGDLNGDGRPDLAVTNFGDKTASVLLNTTAAGATAAAFAAQQTFAAGTQPNSVTVTDYNGDGRPDLAVVNYGDKTVSVLLDTTAPFASTAPVLVGQFGGQGVWEFNRALNTWLQLTAANASVLVADPQGDVAAAFPGYGVWEYKPASGWRQINGVDATALALDARGEVAAQFPGYGVGEYLPAFGWRSLTGANASLLAMDANGDVAGEFPGYGVWLFKPSSGWTQLNGTDATVLAMGDLGEIVANFRGVGVGEYRPTGGWRLLNGVEASSLSMDARGDVFAQFAGYGVGEYLPATGWRTLTGANAARLGAESGEDAFGAFAGYGVWEYDPYRGWFQLTAADASLLAVA
jgi:hypothetical protein